MNYSPTGRSLGFPERPTLDFMALDSRLAEGKKRGRTFGARERVPFIPYLG